MDEYGRAIAHLDRQARASASIPSPQFGPEPEPPPTYLQQLIRLGFFDGPYRETVVRNLWGPR